MPKPNLTDEESPFSAQSCPGVCCGKEREREKERDEISDLAVIRRQHLWVKWLLWFHTSVD